MAAKLIYFCWNCSSRRKPLTASLMLRVLHYTPINMWKYRFSISTPPNWWVDTLLDFTQVIIFLSGDGTVRPDMLGDLSQENGTWIKSSALSGFSNYSMYFINCVRFDWLASALFVLANKKILNTIKRGTDVAALTERQLTRTRAILIKLSKFQNITRWAKQCECT